MDANKIKKGLGRGLSSLIGETKAEININKVSISDLVSNKFQPRKTFDEESLQNLTNSIKERGIIQPIIVRKSRDHSSKYEIIAGERRWLAAQKAGLRGGDIVTALDGQPINGPEELIVAVRSKNVGDVVSLTYKRDGKEKTVSLTLIAAKK